MRITLGELAEWAGARMVGCDPSREITSVNTDSRTVEDGEVFLALRGERFDAHEFIPEAQSKGAAAVIVDHEDAARGGPALVVEDTLFALGEVAHRYRWSQPLIPWVGVTGSNGKTTTREMIACILRTRGPVAVTEGNYNNLVGLPQTILKRREDAWVGVVELGASELGEVARLAHIAMPTVAVVTSTAAAHLKGFGSLETVAHEKAAVFRGLPHDGVAIYPATDPRAGILAGAIVGARATYAVEHDADMVAESVEVTSAGTRFVVRGVPFELNLYGRHNVANCLAALLVAEHMGIGLEDASKALRAMKPVRQRLSVCTTDSLTIVDDVYNANPASTLAAGEVLMALNAPRHVAVLGDMLELGPRSRSLHRDVGRSMSRIGVDVVLAVGRQAVALAEGAAGTSARTTVRHFSSVRLLLRDLDSFLQDGDAVLVKGSRGMRMEEIVAQLKHFDSQELDDTDD